MAINFTLTTRRETNPLDDSMGRTWYGWDPSNSDQELWEQNRGVWILRQSVVEDEKFATLSYDGVIQVVVRITGKQQFFDAIMKSGYKTALTGEVLPVGDPVREAFVGTCVESTRNPVQYIDDPWSPDGDGSEGKQAGAVEFEPRTILLTSNPERWRRDPFELTRMIKQTASGKSVKDQWSTGNSKWSVRCGDRAFLLQQGTGFRGIVASGKIVSDVFQADHWDNYGGEGNYALVEWDTVLDENDALTRENLLFLTPGFSWAPQSSGTELPSPHAEVVEQAWAKHAGKSTPPPKGGQGWLEDPRKRKLAEDHGQDLLETHYRDQGWDVVDTRIGNPYDAVATKDGIKLYLEAKATQRAGDKVLVTPNEVRFARDHAGQCVIGVVAGIRFRADGSLDESAGNLRIYEWTAAQSELTATGYTWAPSALPIVEPANNGEVHRELPVQ